MRVGFSVLDKETSCWFLVRSGPTILSARHAEDPLVYLNPQPPHFNPPSRGDIVPIVRVCTTTNAHGDDAHRSFEISVISVPQQQSWSEPFTKSAYCPSIIADNIHPITGMRRSSFIRARHVSWPKLLDHTTVCQSHPWTMSTTRIFSSSLRSHMLWQHSAAAQTEPTNGKMAVLSKTPGH